jgi:hypothetical protein
VAGLIVSKDNYSRSPTARDVTPLDDHVEIDLHHEREIVEQKIFIRTMRVEASPRPVQ